MAEEKKNMPTIDDQYQRLIEARNFHYNNLNKWLMSFYAIIAALFVAFYKLYAEQPGSEVVMIIAILGYVVSLGALLSGKGYYYWEYKWIERLYRFEKLVLKYNHDDKQVYSALSNKKKHDNPYCPTDGANISTTQIALFVTLCITIAWGFIIVLFGFLDGQFEVVNVLTSLGVSIVASYVFMLIGAAIFPSHLEGLDVLEKPKTDKDMNKFWDRKTYVIVIVTLVAITLLSVVMYFTADKGADMIWLHIAIDTIALTVAVVGVYMAYRIQMSIQHLSEENRKRDMFDQSFHIFVTKIEVINQTYQSWCAQTDESVKRAYANTISTQAMLAYYALSDLVTSEYYKEKIKEQDETKDIFEMLSKLSDKFVMRIAGIKDADEKGIRNTDLTQEGTFTFVNNLNNLSADFIRGIYEITKEDSKRLDARFE